MLRKADPDVAERAKKIYNERPVQTRLWPSNQIRANSSWGRPSARQSGNQGNSIPSVLLMRSAWGTRRRCILGCIPNEGLMIFSISATSNSARCDCGEKECDDGLRPTNRCSGMHDRGVEGRL